MLIKTNKTPDTEKHTISLLDPNLRISELRKLKKFIRFNIIQSNCNIGVNDFIYIMEHGRVQEVTFLGNYVDSFIIRTTKQYYDVDITYIDGDVKVFVRSVNNGFSKNAWGLS